MILSDVNPVASAFRRKFAASAICVALACLCFEVPPAAQPSKPNILLIQADDLGYGDISAYGQAMFQTPNVDRLARNGLRFISYYAGDTVCAPSRAALMTGLHTGHTWIRGNLPGMSLRAEDRTIAMLLKEAGYRTALIGKWGLGESDSPGRPDRKGFEYSFGYLSQTHAHRQFTDHLYRNGERVEVSPNDYSNDLFTKETISFIVRNDNRPFFVYLNYTVPHAELRVPDDSVTPFRGRFPEKPFVNAAADARPTGPDEPSLGYRSQPTPHAAFAAMVTRMDRDVGRIVELLRARGVDQKTLVIFTSDNGPHQEGGADPEFFKGSGGLRGIKRDMYEGGIRVPMIASWPGTIAPGTSTTYAAAHWDLFPTFAELANARIPAGLDGKSIVPVLQGKPLSPHDFLYWEFHERGFQQAVRMGNWKAVRLAKDKPLELYNLAVDPTEFTDVAAKQPEIVAQIEKYLKTARTESPNWPIK
jgi:arylsulfatase A-like enzyme